MTLLSSQTWILINLLSGLLFTLGFAPFHYSPLAIVSLAILFSSWLSISPKKAFIYGYSYGFGVFGLGISWAFVSIYFYGQTHFLIAALLTIGLVGFFALFPAIAAYITVWLAKKNPLSLLILAPIIWIEIEYLRGEWFLNGFPWLQIAYSQIDTVYIGFMPILGVYGSGFLIAITASLISYLTYYQRQYLIFANIISLILVIGALLAKIEWTYPLENKPITATLIQGNISQEDKWRPESFLMTLFTYQQLTYLNWRSDLIIWPETSIPTAKFKVDVPFLQPLAQKAREYHSNVLVSLIDYQPETNRLYNAAFLLGNNSGLYHKQHLLPFGEYLPLQPLSGWILKATGMRLDDFDSGELNQALLHAADYSFGTSICYEDAFGEQSIRDLNKKAFLVNLTNDAWFGISLEPYQHLQMAQMRAVETGRYLLRSTNTGLSAIIAPNGKILSQTELFTTATLTGKILPMTGLTPYAKIGNLPIILFIFLLGITELIRRYFCFN
ncbi:MAG: apolipoprotein N-acyltransferase [Pseudomonadota bacterium]|jgi:apolipoprotein N-acyltransferase